MVVRIVNAIHTCSVSPQLLRFSFNLPSNNGSMEDMARLLQAVMLFIDVVGQYKMSPEQLKRGAKVGVCVDHIS